MGHESAASIMSVSGAKPQKKWQVFPGRNKFCCDGRIMMAPHTGVFYLTVGLIGGTSLLFFLFDCPFLASQVSPVIPAVSGGLFIFTMCTLLRTSFSDPGVIPRAATFEPDAAPWCPDPNNPLQGANGVDNGRPPPRTKEVVIRGIPVKLKYCFTCRMFRPPRASHCSLCDNCVDRFDHHCPWVGNCVGRRNYRYFYMFIMSLAFLAVFMFACVVTHLVMISRDVPFLDAIKKSPGSVIVAVVCFFSVWSVLGLAGFHTYLASSNQTTNEDIKGSFSTRPGLVGKNPYSEGNVCINCCHVLCGPLPPSLIDRRGVITQAMIEELKPIQMSSDESRNNCHLTQPNGSMFPPLNETCGTPSPLQQPCTRGGQQHTSYHTSHTNGSTNVPSVNAPLQNQQFPPPIQQQPNDVLGMVKLQHRNALVTDVVLDIDDVVFTPRITRSPSELTLRSEQENIVLRDIDRTLYGERTSMMISPQELMMDLKHSTMIESELDLDSLEHLEDHSVTSTSSQLGLIKAPL